MIHAGEEVRFDFVLHDSWGNFVSPTGLVDYVIAQVGDDRREAILDARGHFQFVYRFDRVEPGQKMIVMVEALQRREERDWNYVDGQWLQAKGGSAVKDRIVVSDSVELEAYQTSIDITIAAATQELDPDTIVLRLRRDDGSISSVFLDRPGRPGVVMSGPEHDGLYRFRYHPRGTEVNAHGSTEAELTVYDRAGQPHRAIAVIETP